MLVLTEKNGPVTTIIINRPEGASLPFDRAMAREFELGLATVESGETLKGADRFAKGEGRHGKFE